MEIAPPGPKAMSLLAYLASRPEGFALRSELSQLLWDEPTISPSAARHALRQCLFRLKQRLGPASCVIEADSEAIRLDLSRTYIDARELERLTQGGAFEPASALAHCRGPFGFGLEGGGAAFDDWLRAQRAEVDRLMTQVLAFASEHLAAIGDANGSINAARRRVELDSFDEDAQADLIVMLMRFGRRSEAHAAHAACVQSFRRELGAAPGPRVDAALSETREAQQQDLDPLPSIRPVRAERDARSASLSTGRGTLFWLGGITATLGLLVSGVPERLGKGSSSEAAGTILWVSSAEAYATPDIAVADAPSDPSPHDRNDILRALSGEAEFAILYPTGC